MYVSTMLVGLVAIVISWLLEATVNFSGVGWQKRKILLGIALLFNAFGSGDIASQELSVFGVFLVVIALYRSINILRVFQSKMHQEYLKSATKKSFIYLAAGQFMVLGIWQLFNQVELTVGSHEMVLILSWVLLASGAFLLLTAVTAIVRTRAKQIARLDTKLPTVSLAIPARNENHALSVCLKAAIASDYPKLEVLVYDDCSQDKTAETIKEFARDGVRFIKGEKPDEKHWLAKNMACQALLEQASGDIVLYTGVDVILAPQTISQLVAYLNNNKLNMLSVLPKRYQSGMVAALIQPMRYWYELALPQWLVHRPPVLSSCWLIKRAVLQKMGGFKAVARAIIPEEHFAKQCNQTGSYTFIRSNNQVGLTSQKDFVNQWQTAIRTRYPQAHRRPEILAVKTILMLAFLLMPFAVFVAAILAHHGLLAVALSAMAVLFLVASHVLIMLITNPAATYVALINFPLVVLLDIAAMHISMYKYEFSEVIWKGRNVSVAAMHVYPNLPRAYLPQN